MNYRLKVVLIIVSAGADVLRNDFETLNPKNKIWYRVKTFSIFEMIPFSHETPTNEIMWMIWETFAHWRTVK